MKLTTAARLGSTLLSLLLLALPQARAQATNWPDKPVKIINPFPAGGASDTLVRIMADELQKRLGQSFVVENRTGAGGNIGMESGAKSAADGSTLMSATIGTLSINQFLYPRLGYEPESLGYVSTFWANCNVVMVPAAHNPSRTLADFIAWAKARPQGISYGSSGVGTTPHLAGELFQQRTGIRSTHIPTRGGPQTVSLLLAGNIDVAIDNMASYAAFLANGQVRGLAVTCPERWPTLPDVPTMAEAGMPDFVMTSWGAIVAPPGTPQPVLDKLSRTMADVAANPAIQKRFLEVGARLTTTTPQETAAFAARERKRWGDLVRTTGMKAE